MPNITVANYLRAISLCFILFFAQIHDAVSQTTYYSRVTTGNWFTNATWSTSGCGGAAATSTPGATDNVVICNGSTITFNATAPKTIADLTIQTGGTLRIDVNKNLFVNSFVLNGIVNDNGGGDIRVGNTIGSTLSGTGSFATTNNKTQLRLVKAVTVPAGSDLKFSDAGRLHLAGKTLTNNGKITIGESSALAGGGTFINNAATSTFVFSRNNNNNFGNTVLIATAAGNTVEFSAPGGTRFTDAQGSYHHLIISGGGTKRLRATSVSVAGNLTIRNGVTLDAFNATDINVAGHWTNNLGGSFTEQNCTVTFNGSANNQTIAPPTGGETFYNLTINNTFAGGTVTAGGDIYITDDAVLTMTSGTFDMTTYTLDESGGSADFTATGGNLRFGKLSATLPELSGTYNITGGTITFSGTGTQSIRALNAAPAAYYNIALGGSGSKTLTGDIAVTGNWTNIGATRAGNYTVTFSGSGVQTITNTAGESFYGLATNTTGPLTFAGSTDVTVTNALNLTSGNININGRTLTLGNGSGATLTRTSGICFGGTFRRYFPATTISSSSSPLYGLFPIGTSVAYRPVTLNSTVSPSTAGYVSASHTDATTASNVSYNDNQGVSIQRVTDMRSTLTAPTVNGTYTVGVTFTALSSAGNLSDLRLETLAGSPPGVGTHLATTGSVANPVGSRSGVTASQLNNVFVMGTINRTTTPLVSNYYSRRSGNWTDATTGNATWSFTDGGGSCDCSPTSSSVVIINPTHTVTVNSGSTADFVTVRTGATLNGTAAFAVNYDLSTEGSGKISPTAGAWTITRDLSIQGTSTSTLGSGLIVGSDLQIDAGNALTLGANSSVAGNLIVDGTLNVGTYTLTLSGTGTSISGSSGTALINGSGTGNLTVSGNKSIASGSNLNVKPIMALGVNTTLNNLGTVTTTGDVTGVNATSIWTNAASSSMTTSAAFLTTGTLNANAAPNTFTYNGTGAQTVKSPATSYYNLLITNSGVKTTGGNVAITNLLSIQTGASLNAGTFTLNGSGGLTMNGTSSLTLSKTGVTLPELSGTYNLAGGTITMSPASGTSPVRGVSYNNLVLNPTGTGAFSFAANPTINNDFVFGGSSSATSTMNGNVTSGTFTQSSGTFAMASGTTLELSAAGGWTKNGGTFNPNASSTVLFSGSSDQSIGGSSVTTFANVEISNSGASGLILNQDATVGGTLTFTEGNLISTASNTLTMNAGAAVADVSDDSYVDGPMNKIGNTSFDFPVGKDGSYRPISINPTGSSSTFQAQYFHSDPTGAGYNVNTKAVTLTRVNNGEYWILDRTSGSATAEVTLSWDDFSGIVDEKASLRVAHWVGGSWVNEGNGGTTGNVSPATGTIRTASGLSVFSPFTLASSNANNPLPVELLSFTGELTGDTVWLNWKTASELNNAFFSIERSRSGKSFESLGTVPGAGTSMLTRSYTYSDEDPLSGISYYRLKQTDYDGEFSYSNVIAIDNRGGSDELKVDVFPNPSDNQHVGIFVDGLQANESLSVEIMDTAGHLIISAEQQSDANGHFTYAIHTERLNPGVYLVKIRSAKGTVVEKFVHAR